MIMQSYKFTLFFQSSEYSTCTSDSVDQSLVRDFWTILNICKIFVLQIWSTWLLQCGSRTYYCQRLPLQMTTTSICLKHGTSHTRVITALPMDCTLWKFHFITVHCTVFRCRIVPPWTTMKLLGCVSCYLPPAHWPPSGRAWNTLSLQAESIASAWNGFPSIDQMIVLWSHMTGIWLAD